MFTMRRAECSQIGLNQYWTNTKYWCSTKFCIQIGNMCRCITLQLNKSYIQCFVLESDTYNLVTISTWITADTSTRMTAQEHLRARLLALYTVYIGTALHLEHMTTWQFFYPHDNTCTTFFITLFSTGMIFCAIYTLLTTRLSALVL